MRKSFFTASAVVASVGLLTVGTPTASQAYTKKELNICWTNQAEGTTDLEVVADGSAFKSGHLNTGDCMAWDVTPGQYKITVEDLSKFLKQTQDECASYAASHPLGYNANDGDHVANDPQDNPRGTVKIKRQNHSYQAWPLGSLMSGDITTYVKRDRRTSVSIVFYCSATPESFGIL